MKVAHGRVVNGTVVTDAPLPEGARVAIMVDDDEPPFELDAEDEVAIEAAVRQLDAGAGRPVSELADLLERHR